MDDDDDERETIEIDGIVYDICSEIQNGAVRVARAVLPPDFEMAYVVKYDTDKCSDDDRARLRREVEALVRLQEIQSSTSMPIVDWDLTRLAYSMPRGDISLQEAVEGDLVDAFGCDLADGAEPVGGVAGGPAQKLVTIGSERFVPIHLRSSIHSGGSCGAPRPLPE